MNNVKRELNDTVNQPVTYRAFMAIATRDPFFGPVYSDAKDITFHISESVDGVIGHPLERAAGEDVGSLAPEGVW